ncbi:MAG: glycosyltransferase family 4 protein [Acidimicrobiales bacterium]
MGLTVGIDASRARSGGAKAHLIGMIREGRPADHGISQVHVWSYASLSNALPERSWLIRHSPVALERGLFWQVMWQRFALPRRARELGCDVVLNTDAGTVARFRPSVTMSNDALSYEPGEMSRYKYSKAWLRLMLLRYLQNSSLKSSEGCVFLTQYMAQLIQQYTGPLPRVQVIPHGTDPEFNTFSSLVQWPANHAEPIKLVYVSNVALYKHQWHVVRAVSMLARDGYNPKLFLAGGTDGWRAQRLLNEAVETHDPRGTLVEALGHVPRDLLPDLLAQSHIFVFASSCEALSVTLLEGMASGLPIASSNRGPLPEVLQQGGVYFDPEDATSIASALKRLIEDSDDRREFAWHARERSTSFSWERTASMTFAFLAEVARASAST